MVRVLQHLSVYIIIYTFILLPLEIRFVGLASPPRVAPLILRIVPPIPVYATFLSHLRHPVNFATGPDPLPSTRKSLYSSSNLFSVIYFT
jgi:hypothetical protein